MTVYADANLLIRLDLDLDATEVRQKLFAEECRTDLPLPVTDLLRCEVRNGIGRMVFEARHGGQLRVTPEAAAAGQALFDEEFAAGVVITRVPLGIDELTSGFDELALRHTAKHGFPTYDIMHVSSALHLGCTRFLSFDKNAVGLAKLEGLQTT